MTGGKIILEEKQEKKMLNKKIISIVLGVMCFALTLGICVQIRTVENSNSKVSNNYQENNLRAEVLKYKEKYDNKYNELEKAEKELEEKREDSTKNNSELDSDMAKIRKNHL